jgi:hypothetical protein
MDMGRLELMDKRVQIITAVELGATHGGDLWQTNHMGRQLFQISQIDIDIKFDKIIIRTNPILNISDAYPVFIRLRYRNLICRLNPGEFKILGDKLICDYPHEALALAPRNGDRYVLPVGMGISISVKRIERSMMEIPREIGLRVIDFSEKGFGILISGAIREFLKSQNHFWLKAIDQRPLRNENLGRVTYVAPKGYYLRRGDVRVDLSLNRALSQDIYENLKKKCNIILSA